MKVSNLKLFKVSEDNNTLFECDCCGKLLPANKMIWGLDELDCQQCFGKTCFKKLQKQEKENG